MVGDALDEGLNASDGGSDVSVEIYSQRVNQIVKKVFTTDYQGEPVQWAVFPRGTVVMVPASAATTANELAVLAQGILRESGPVFPGSSSADFNPIQLENFFGEGCAEWFVIFELGQDAPPGSLFFGVHVEVGTSHALPIGLRQRAARMDDSIDCQVACTSFDLPPKVIWSPDTHSGFSLASRELVMVMLLVQRRCTETCKPFVSHEMLVKLLLPMLVE